MVKEQYRETDVIRRIAKVSFGIESAQEIQQQAHIQVVAQNLYNRDASRTPVVYGMLDRRMGMSVKDAVCGTCNKGLNECVGHFGYIDLELPVFHVGYFKATVTILQTICKSCSRVLLPADKRKNFQASLRNPKITYLVKTSLRKQIQEACKKVGRCPHCGEINGTVKKCGMLKISHEKFRSQKKDSKVVQDELEAYEDISSINKEIKKMVKSSNAALVKILNPLEIMYLLERIPDEDIQYLLMNPAHSHPKDMILTRIPVPPACTRPSVVDETMTGTREDDLTMKLTEIVFLNDVIMKHRESGAKIQMILEDWDFLQLQCALYIDSELAGIPLDRQPKKPSRGLIQRLKGKQGRFRGNLSGKRVDFTARTVISPDPTLRIDEVGVPELVAKILTYPERVTERNIKLMQQLVRNGADVHPGANYLQEKGSNTKKFLKFHNRLALADRLKHGDIIERHLMDGDIVLLNRQPSLHKLSIMCHKAKVLPHRTFRFNGFVCTPYNANFDGDEMNLHFPQTEEARAEACILMGNKYNLVTPRNGELAIAAIQDFITGAYLITHKDSFFDRGAACQLLAQMLAGDCTAMYIKLPPPCIQKPRALWSGKQIFSLILRPSPKNMIKVNLNTKGKEYSGKGKELCIKDSWLLVRNSEVLAGSVDKSTIGAGSKKNIFYSLLRDYGEEEAILTMWKLCRVTAYYMMNRGFSIGIGDITPGKKLLEEQKNLLDKGYGECDELIRDLKENRLKCSPGCSPEDTLESKIIKVLSQIRDTAGNICKKELHPSNSLLVMSKSGSKGSCVNISKMIVCVGQQVVDGKRVPNDFEDRCLPHFKRHSKAPAAKGFVSNSFYSGLTPMEYFFHTMSAREGLIKKGIQTSVTGYMQRRLVKSLEDLCVQYDGTVRNSTGEIIQFIYGGDRLDPTLMEDDDRPVELHRTLEHIKAVFPHPEEEPMDNGELMAAFETIMDTEAFLKCGEDFRKELRQFIFNLSAKIKDVRARHKMNNRTLLKVEKQLERFTHSQLVAYCDFVKEKYEKALIEPGTAVGVLCAQSFGEPITQMYLDAPQFSSVPSMNSTQGVLRIEEIINASKKISTPVITASLMDDKDPEFARVVKGRIEKTILSEVTEYFEEVYLPNDCFIFIKLDVNRIWLLKLEVDARSIAYSIHKSKLKVKENCIEVISSGMIVVRPPASNKSSVYYVMQHLKEELPKVVIKGLPTVTRAIINLDDKQTPPVYNLFVEGDNMREVMATYGVKGTKTKSNNIHEIYSTLGIEAARDAIVHEVKYVMKNHGMTVDRRHVALLADLMTCRGEVLGVTRHGLVKMKESVLMMASFERTTDHLFDAAYYGQEDHINGVSECIIVGNPIQLGTGAFKLFYKTDKMTPPKERPLLFDLPEHHVPMV